MPISDRFKNWLTYGLGTVAVFVTLFGGGWAVGTTVTGNKTELALIAELASCQTRSAGTPGVEGGRENGREIKLTVLSGDTGQVGDRLIISVVGIRASYDPISYVVTANFGARGEKTLPAPGLRIGDSRPYNGYEIRLLEANLAMAKFGIRETGPGK